MKREYSPNLLASSWFYFSIRQICCIIFGKKQKLTVKDEKDDTVRNTQSKFDRETIAVLLGDKKMKYLKFCNVATTLNHSYKTANDLQIMDN
jgi:hypothetical protein